MPETAVPSIQIKIEGIPESTGLRIRAVGPVGVYVSSHDARTAQFFGGMLLMQFALVVHTLAKSPMKAEPGMCFRLKQFPPDWAALTDAGGGTLELEMIRMIPANRPADMTIPADVRPMRLNRSDYPSGELCMFAHEAGDEYAIAWIQQQIKEDIKRSMH